MKYLFAFGRASLAAALCSLATVSCVSRDGRAGIGVEEASPPTPTASEMARRDIARLAPGASVMHYVVPAMSVIQRLPDVYPPDGVPNGELRIIAARDEYEPGSFQLFSTKNLNNVELSVSPLVTKDGKRFPDGELDLTVIKVWYQNGNGWFSYFADPGLKLTPELLLHDENLIKVDRARKANFARVDFPNGTRYRWISAPRYMDDGFKTDNRFKFSISPFKDAKKLKPFSLKSGEFKQFFLTVHVDGIRRPGIYRGKIAVKVDGKPVAFVPVALRVLPFTLHPPKTYFDRKRDFVVALMSGVSPKRFLKRTRGDEKAAEKLVLSVLKDQRRHNILHAKIDKLSPRSIELLKQAGISTNPVISVPSVPWYGMHWGGRHKYDHIISGRLAAETDAAFFKKHLGHTNVILKYADEPGANFVAMARPLFTNYLKYDFLVGTAGHAQIFNKAGYMWRYISSGCFPEDDEKGKTPYCFNKMGAKGYTGFYAGQHNGVENPQFVRRQHGMLSYLRNWSMIYNYEFGFNTWNDLSEGLYKPMNLAYPTSDGAVDTLAWEGFREGVDDMRYATKLMRLADLGEHSRDLKLKIASRKAKQYVALLDPETMDLNAVRLEMINKILELMRLGAKD